MRYLIPRLTSLLLSALLIVSPLGAAATAHALPSNPVALSHSASGEEAIAALGADLPAVAAAHGKSAEALERAFREDKTLNVDTKGRLFYREEAVSPAEAAATAEGASLPATAPLSDTFLLHSKPGSKRVIFLDFDGYTLTGTSWNGGTIPDPLVCPAWDTDGNPSSFSDAERTAVQQVWQRVAEDYAPFDVDVTTQDPGEAAIVRDSSADQYYGNRVLISPISSYFGSYGGISYVGVFDSIGSANKPSLVFPEKLANNERYIAEAASHENGHSLGLLHDGTTSGTEYYAGQGTGATSWAPIMGSGYYKSVTQWSKGEYNLANNTEDDLAIINAHGAIYRTDDYGNTAAAATALPIGTSIAANGILERTGDVDVLSFNAGAGTVSVSAGVAPRGADLDVALELRDAAGNVVASADPTTTITASLTTPVAAGTYYLFVRGSGWGDPKLTGYSNYGSLGNWSITGTVPAPTTNVAPVAQASATPVHGIAPVTCAFDGSASYDPDGSIASYVWDFGDGTSATGATASHTYAAPGAYTATLTVADDSGAQNATTVSITVDAANVAPTASFVAPTSATVGTAVTFDGTASSDPDGSIANYAWDFGDGTTGTGASVSHSYAAAGTYTASLTVTDNDGATATQSATIVVSPQAAITMHVANISISYVSTKAGKTARAVVYVVDNNGLPVSGATVTGTWSGATTGTSTGSTDANGNATLSSKNFKKGTVSFTVTNVTKAGYAYVSGANAITKRSRSIR